MPERLSYAELSCRNGRKREKEKYENRKYSNEKVGKNSDGSTCFIGMTILAIIMSWKVKCVQWNCRTITGITMENSHAYSSTVYSNSMVNNFVPWCAVVVVPALIAIKRFDQCTFSLLLLCSFAVSSY